MHWQYTSFTPVLVLAGVLALCLAIYAWRRRAVPTAAVLGWLMLAVAEWCWGYAVELASMDLDVKILWAKIQYVGIVSVPILWLAFVICYTGRSRWITLLRVFLVSVVPILVLILVWTNEVHGLIWADVWVEDTASGLVGWGVTYGWAFWVHMGYAYVVVVASAVMLVQALVRSPRLYRDQVVALLVGASVPWIGNIFSIFVLDGPLDLTPLGFVLAGLALTWALFRFKLLDIGPVARDTVVESMTDGVIVLDAQDRIVDLNPAARLLLGRDVSGLLGLDFAEATALHPELSKGLLHAADPEAEVMVCLNVPASTEEGAVAETETHTRHYTVRSSPLQRRRGRLAGRLVILQDVTERVRAENALLAQKGLFERLVAIARATTERPTLEATLQDALTSLTAMTDAEYGTLFILNEDRVVTHHLAMRGKEPLEQWREVSGKVMDQGLAGWVVSHRELVVIEDTLEDERWLNLPDSVSGVRAALSVPIVSGTMVSGVLTLTHSKPGHFEVAQVELVQAAADQLVLALRNAQIFDAQQRIAEQQSTLYHVLRSVVGQLDPGDVIEVALESIVQFAGWQDVVVALLNEDQTAWEIQPYGKTVPPGAGRLHSLNEGIIGRALRTLEPQRVADVSLDPDYIPGHTNIRSELAVPLRHGEQLFGCLDVESPHLDAFDEQDELLAGSLADTMALALENASHYVAARQQAMDLSSLYTVTRMTSQSLTLESVLSQALSSVLISLEFEAGIIALADPNSGDLYPASEYGLPRHLSELYDEDGLAETLTEHVHKVQNSIVVRDFRREKSEELGEFATQMARFGLRGYAGIPLLHHDTSFGAMSLFSHRRKTFSSNQMVLLEAIGRQVATAVANARLYQVTVNERQRLVTLIESSRDGIILVGLDQQILVVNHAAIEFLRLMGQPDDWTAQPLHRVFGALKPYAPDAVDMMATEMERIQVGDESAGEWECAVAARTLLWFNLPVVADTNPLGRLLVVRDVTEERMLSRLRDDLTHTMVHDLRNPLTGISTALKLLNRKLTDKLTPAQHRLIEIADNSAEKMIGLVSAILDLSRLESGHMPMQPTSVSLTDLISEALSLQDPIAASNDLTLGAHVPSSTPNVWADRELVGRVLQNLVGNATKFTPAGGRIDVSVSPESEQEGDEVALLRISVTDTGPGISPELQSSLFQKFVMGDHENHGSGLGLAFCRLAVEAHGGRIWVESQPGEGATFSFTLPIVGKGGTL